MEKRIKRGKGFHILAKPNGPACNMDCGYCFYSEKAAFFKGKRNSRMPENILESFIKNYIESSKNSEVQFVWQGGEPTLLGVEYFRKIISLQKRYASEKKIYNSIQTNGTLLDDEWCTFLKEYDFLVGLSMDGTERIHDRYRVYPNGKSSFNKVLMGLSFLQKYDVRYNILACVTRESSKYPLEIYRFFKNAGVQFIQFSPIVERLPSEPDKSIGLKHGRPMGSDNEEKDLKVAAFTVEAEAYGDFLIRVFQEWVKKDVGSIYVMNFEWALQAWVGLPASYCFFTKQCGGNLVIEHDGGIYACDHYVYPEYRLGDIMNGEIMAMAESDSQMEFGIKKETSLPRVCRECDVLFACNGECPRHRFLKTADGEPGLNYLCVGYKKYFRHIHPYMKVMGELIAKGIPAAEIMKLIKNNKEEINYGTG